MPDPYPQDKVPPWINPNKPKLYGGVPVDRLAFHYGVHTMREGVRVLNILHEHPTLCYLLGKVEPAFEITNGQSNRVVDTRPDGVERQVSFLTQGSGMFGLTDPQDAMRWKGIFNHVVGTARQVKYIADRLVLMGDSQREQLAIQDYDISSLDGLMPDNLFAFMLVSHAGRRQMDEFKWHGLRDSAHPTGDSGENTVQLLTGSGIHPDLIGLMRIEQHNYLVDQAKSNGGIFPDIVDNVLTYCDWTFGQAPNTLKERFDALRRSGRAEPETLDILQAAATRFEQVLTTILGKNFFEQMSHAYLPDEDRIREAYALSAGMQLQDIYPGYVAYRKDAIDWLTSNSS